MSLDHYQINKLLLRDLQNPSQILINTGGGSQYITSYGYIIKTIFDISSNIEILYKSLDYPILKKNINISEGYLIHYAKRYREFEELEDKIIHIPYTDNSFDKTINNTIQFKDRLNKCYWRGGCLLNGHLRHTVCNILKESIYCDVKIYNPANTNTNISTNI